MTAAKLTEQLIQHLLRLARRSDGYYTRATIVKALKRAYAIGKASA